MSLLMSKGECDQHIREIRKSHGADSDNEGSAFLRRGYESMLKLLSAQLYTVPSHFLFELIQNADDNSYPDDIEPTASLIYRDDGFFFFGCNEIGFNKDNVQAICDIDSSTKVLLKGDKGCIGEKGIGFKAVFKVASQVWISSGNYDFKFDKRQPLGMVTPSLEAFPSLPDSRKMTTMVALKIDDPEHMRTIREQLELLDASSFMFLRRLVCVNIVHLDKNSKIIKESALTYTASPMSDLRLVKASKTSDSGSTISKYLVSSFTVTSMPEIAQRQKVKESTIKLAFPVDDKWMPQLAAQQVYAFLSVCASGFPFLIQGDFLLVASRQNVDESLIWNKRLRDHIMPALINAFHSLRSLQLRYTWVMFLPEEGQCPIKFFRDIVSKLIRRLNDTKILESSSEVVVVPRVLLLVPDKYRDDEGTPLLLHQTSRYLASQYPPQHVSALVTNSLDHEKFLKELINFVRKNMDAFKSKSAKWHSRLSSALLVDLRHGINVESLYPLPLIPLADGTWIAARSSRSGHGKLTNINTFYLPEAQKNVSLPRGLTMSIIQNDAADDTERIKLYRRLGGKDIDYDQICAEMIKVHKDQKATKALNTPIAISHARFLFSMPTTYKSPNLYGAILVADRMGTLCKSNEIYMNKPNAEHPVSKLLATNYTIARFLHPDYLEVFKDDPNKNAKWISWVETVLGVNTIPRLVNKANTGISGEFLWIVQNTPSRQWLHRLKSHWKDYHLHMPPSSSNDSKIPSQAVRDQLSNSIVTCCDGKIAKLNETLLPTLRTVNRVADAARLQFLDITHETDADWQKFSALGVITSTDARFYVRVLVRLQQSNFMFKDLNDARMLYGHLQSKCDTYCDPNTKEFVQLAFKARPLIFVVRSKRGEWTHMTDCIWEAPPCLRKIVPLAPIYDNQAHLFQGILGIKNATAAYIIKELATLHNLTTEVELIKDMLSALSEKLKLPKERYKIEELDGLKIFPVISLSGAVMLVSNRDKRWFIPDGPSLKKAFLNRVLLLDFTQTGQEMLQPLLDKMFVADRKLSQRAMVREYVNGKEAAVLDEHHTATYRERSHYLLSLVSKSRDLEIRSLLEGMEVYAVDSIVTRRSVEIDMQEVFGTDEVGSVVIDHGMKIYVPASALGTNRLDVSDFAEKISAFCKISVKLLHVLFVVLHPTSEMCVIEKTLEHNNINFEKRERPVNAGKVVDDSAGIILPSKPVVAKKDASEVHPKLTTVLVETNKPTHLAPAVPDKTTSNSQGVTAMLKQPLSAPRQRISHMAGSVPSVKHQPSLEYCDTEAEDSTESSADSELYNMKARHGIDTVSPQDYPALETRKALIRGRSSHDGTNRDTVARKSRPTTQRDCGLSPSTGRTANSRQDLSVLDDELNNIMPRSGPSGGNGPSKRLPGDNKLKSSFARSSTPLNNEGQLDLMEDHHVVRIGQQGELKFYELLGSILGSDCTPELWTSQTRTSYTGSAFEEDESLYADFTFADTKSLFTKWLAGQGNKLAKLWLQTEHEPIEYSLEIKSTYGHADEAFHLSQNQLNMAENLEIDGDATPTHVYAIMRLSDLVGGDGVVNVYPIVDPWRMIQDGDLTLYALNGYSVTFN